MNGNNVSNIKVFINHSKTGKELCPHFLANKDNLIKIVAFLSHEYPHALITWDGAK